jgi:hypothetical protein
MSVSSDVSVGRALPLFYLFFVSGLQLNSGNTSVDIVFSPFSCNMSTAACISGRTATAELPGGPQPTVAVVSTAVPAGKFTLEAGSHVYRFITAVATR